MYIYKNIKIYGLKLRPRHLSFFLTCLNRVQTGSWLLYCCNVINLCFLLVMKQNTLSSTILDCRAIITRSFVCPWGAFVVTHQICFSNYMLKIWFYTSNPLSCHYFKFYLRIYSKFEQSAVCWREKVYESIETSPEIDNWLFKRKMSLLS